MTFLIFLLIVAGGLAVFVAKQPDEFIVTRSMSTTADAERIFPLVNDLQQWHAWSPWAKQDPNAKIKFDGPQEGVGAAMRWHGNARMGVGKMTITDSRPYESIQLKLEFTKPMQATNTATFRFKHLGTHTEVTWTMRGTNNFVGKAMWLIMRCEKMIGDQFRQGLAAIKSIVESGGGATPQRVVLPPLAAKSSPGAHSPSSATSSVVMQSPQPVGSSVVLDPLVSKSSGPGSGSGGW